MTVSGVRVSALPCSLENTSLATYRARCVWAAGMLCAVGSLFEHAEQCVTRNGRWIGTAEVFDHPMFGKLMVLDWLDNWG